MNLSPQNNIFYSADFEICSALGQINIGTASIRVGLVNMKVLVVLLENRGQVISRAELFDKVWKNQVVSDDTLTRCISDLRALLGKHSNEKLIETIPKRGYRWIAEVTNLESADKKVIDQNPKIREVNKSKKITSIDLSNLKSLPVNHWKAVIIWVVSGALGFLMLSTLLLWGVNQFTRTDMIRVALLPMQIDNQQYKEIATNFDSLLKAELLKTSNIRFLSSRTFDDSNQKLYPYLSREFAAQWIIESRLVYLDEKLRISINIVDAKTAIVTQSFHQEISSNEVNLKEIVKALLMEIEANIG